MIQSPPVATAASRIVLFDAERRSVGVARRFRQWWIARRTRQIVAKLTDEQLADVGIDRSSVTGPVSIQVVERGYHANAIGWR